MDRKLELNIIKIYLMAFFQAAMVITAIYVPLLQGYGLTMAQVMQTQALFALTVAVSEVPSGYLADLWGRKNTIVCGAALCAIGFSLLCFADSYWEFMLYELILGVGISLNSGTDLALLYDTQSYLSRHESAVSNGQHISRLISLEGVAGAVAAVLASILMIWSLQWVVVIQAIVGFAPLLIALTLVESPREISVSGHRENATRVKAAIIEKPLVLSITLTLIVFNLAAIYGFWLYQKYWEVRGIPLTYFGYLWALHCLVRSIAARFANEVESLFGSRLTLLLVAILNIVGLAGMALTPGLIGVYLALLLPISRGVGSVILYDGLNKRLTSEFRATVNSLVNLGFRSIFILTGPLLGVLTDRYGVESSLLLLAAVFTPTFGFVLFLLFRSIREEKALVEIEEHSATSINQPIS